MAVAFDAASESHTGTTPSTSVASFNWSHLGGSPQGVVVFVISTNSSVELGTRVTYGGVDLGRIPGAAASDTATETGQVQAWFLGCGIPTGTQTVEVTRTNNASECYAVCFTVTAAGCTQAAGHVVNLSENGTVAEQAVTDLPNNGLDSLRFGGGFSGLATFPAAGASSTAGPTITIATARTAGAWRETTAGLGSRSVGGSSGTSDDRAMTHVAVREAVYQLAMCGVGG